MNPLRTRERAYCSQCDAYLCDGCGAVRAQTLECRPMAKVIDETLLNALFQPKEH
jgi:hypothetical protein